MVRKYVRVNFDNAVTLEVLKKRYVKLKKNLGRIPKRCEIPYTMVFQRKFCLTWRQFVEQMGDKPIGSGYTKTELKNIIFDFNKKHGRPPSADEMTRPSSKVFQNVFGTWSNLLKECNFYVKHPMYISEDGHKCLSRPELYIDNWLYKNNIEHEKEVKYPYHKIYNKNTRKRCDFFINGIYIEFFGLMRRKSYREKVKIKKKLIKQLNLKIIFIYPTDLDKLDKIIPTKFGRNLH